MNILFTRELARRWSNTGVTANALHPGFVASNFAKEGDVGWWGNIGMPLAAPVRDLGAGRRAHVGVRVLVARCRRHHRSVLREVQGGRPVEMGARRSGRGTALGRQRQAHEPRLITGASSVAATVPRRRRRLRPAAVRDGGRDRAISTHRRGGRRPSTMLRPRSVIRIDSDESVPQRKNTIREHPPATRYSPPNTPSAAARRACTVGRAAGDHEPDRKQRGKLNSWPSHRTTYTWNHVACPLPKSSELNAWYVNRQTVATLARSSRAGPPCRAGSRRRDRRSASSGGRRGRSPSARPGCRRRTS